MRVKGSLTSTPEEVRSIFVNTRHKILSTLHLIMSSIKTHQPRVPGHGDGTLPLTVLEQTCAAQN